MSRPISELSAGFSVAERLFIQATESGVTTILKNARDLARVNTSGRILEARSGRLRASIRERVTVQGADVRGTLEAGQGIPYAEIHEQGGVIHGRPWLTYEIPGVGWRRSAMVRIPRRPYLQPALEQAQRDLGPELEREFSPLLNMEIVR